MHNNVVNRVGYMRIAQNTLTVKHCSVKQSKFIRKRNYHERKK